MTLFDEPPTLESLLARIEALEAKVMDKPARQSTEVPPEIREAWNLWYLHKASDKRWTAAAKKLQVAKLADLSGLNTDAAVKIVEAAIDGGWATFYPLKEQPKLTSVQSVTGAKAAFKSSETPLERDVARAMQDHHFGVIDTAERDRRIAEATQRHRGMN